MPELNIEPMRALHKKIKTALIQELKEEQDPETIRSKLANAEEIIAKLYQAVSEFYAELSQKCDGLSKLFHKLQKEELNHRDYLLQKD